MPVLVVLYGALEQSVLQMALVTCGIQQDYMFTVTQMSVTCQDAAACQSYQP